MTKIQRKTLKGTWVTVVAFASILSEVEKQELLRALRPCHRIIYS